MLGKELPEAVLRDWRTAPIDERLRAMLGFLEKLTLTPEAITVEDARALRRAGVSAAAAKDAVHVAFVFAFFTRMADALGFDLPTDGNKMAVTMLLSPIGYR